MTTLKEFLEAGYKFEAGDKIGYPDDNIIVTSCNIDRINALGEQYHLWHDAPVISAKCLNAKSSLERSGAVWEYCIVLSDGRELNHRFQAESRQDAERIAHEWARGIKS